ncbi:MAG: LysR family transcriptional regulator, partial [Pseudomonadota bacterium]
MNIDWNAIQSFVSVAKHGTFSEASKELGVSIPTTGRRIDLLESQVGAPLFRRGPQGATLTQQGTLLLQYAEKGAKHFGHISRLSRVFRDGPTDLPIRISATEAMVADVLAPRIEEPLQSYPGIKIELDVTNSLSDINAGEADIAIRMVRPTGDSLVTRKLPTIGLGLYCSNAYLGNRDPAEIRLEDERLLWLDRSLGDIAENQWLLDNGLESAAVLRAVSVRALLQATIAGAGIGLLPDYSATHHGLIKLRDSGVPARTPWLAFHRDTRNQPKMKAIRSWIVKSC